jgi:hypothetical protein
MFRRIRPDMVAPIATIAVCPFCAHNDAMLMMNRGKAAKLHYMANGFRMLSSGDHVVCAVSGEQIPLDELRYWSVVRQEPYASAEISTRAALTKR